MGLFDRIFRNNDSGVSKPAQQAVRPQVQVSFDSEINAILDVLRNLGLLDSKTIDERIKKSGSYNSSVFKRIMIRTDEKNIAHLLKYFENIKLGYGESKITEFREDLKDLAKQKVNAGKNNQK